MSSWKWPRWEEPGVAAVRVQNWKELADRHRDTSSRTIALVKREKDGWPTECFAPRWFTFDGKPFERPSATSRIGADGPGILAELGYSPADIEWLHDDLIVGRTEWAEAHADAEAG